MAHSNLGQILVATNNIDEGLHHLELATEYEPENVMAWDNLARIRILLGAPKDGEYAAMRTLQLSPQDSRVHTRLGLAVAAQQRLKEAIVHYQNAINLNRTNDEAWTQLGISHFLRNDLGSAQEALQAANTLNPNNTNTLRHLALVSLGLGNTSQAITYFEKLLSLNPRDDHSRLDLAVLFLSSKQTHRAVQNLESLSEKTKNSSKYQFYYGIALQQQGRVDEGKVVLCDLATRDDPYGEKARKMVYPH